MRYSTCWRNVCFISCTPRLSIFAILLIAQNNYDTKADTSDIDIQNLENSMFEDLIKNIKNSANSYKKGLHLNITDNLFSNMRNNLVSSKSIAYTFCIGRKWVFIC